MVKSLLQLGQTGLASGPHVLIQMALSVIGPVASRKGTRELLSFSVVGPHMNSKGI